MFRKFIFDRDIDGFIRFSIQQLHSEEKFFLEQAIRYVFKSNELFVYLLRRRNVETKYSSEFLAFYDALQTEDGKTGIPLEFFKVIPVQHAAPDK